MRLTYCQIRVSSYRELDKDYVKQFADMGFGVLGFPIDLNATDDDCTRIVDLFGELGIAVGQVTAGKACCMLHPTPAVEREYEQTIMRALEIGGKIGATALQFSVGTLNPDNVWGIHPDNDTQRSLDLLVARARRFTPVAEDTGCMISPETTQWTIVNTIERMKEYVERLDSPYMKIVFDPVNHMTPERLLDSGPHMRRAIAYLGDCIGALHVKDAVPTANTNLVCHIDEAKMGTGWLDHAALIEASAFLEPWKNFILEHIRDAALIKPAHDHIAGIASRIGHVWTDPLCTRERWE
jgi:sugar phosphate isomerase/epimerase